MNSKHVLRIFRRCRLANWFRIALSIVFVLNTVLPAYATGLQNNPLLINEVLTHQNQSGGLEPFNLIQPEAIASAASPRANSYPDGSRYLQGNLNPLTTRPDEIPLIAEDEPINAFSPAVYLLDLLDFVKDTFGPEKLESTLPTTSTQSITGTQSITTENFFNPPDLGSNENIDRRFMQRFEDIVVSQSVDQQASYVQFSNEILENLIVELDTANLKDENLLQRDDPWQSVAKNHTNSIAWGDMDGDGYLDLAVGKAQDYSLIHWNNGGRLPTGHSLALDNSYVVDQNQKDVTSVTWGDVNGDGYPELAAGTSWAGPIIFSNATGVLETTPYWIADEGDEVTNIAWGDMNLDGYPELAVGYTSFGASIYLNREGTLDTRRSWFDRHETTTSVAWGDMNLDGYLDLAIGVLDADAASTFVYLNNGDGRLQTTPSFTATNDAEVIRSLAWGDMNNDDYPDLAVGNFYSGTKVYLNREGMLTTEDMWTSHDDNHTTSLAWGDVDSDGDLDLAVGSAGRGTRVYRNDEGRLPTEASWTPHDNDDTTSIAWGDADGDGDLDLAVGVEYGANKIYLNPLADTYAHEPGFDPNVMEDLFDSYLRELDTTRDDVQLILKVSTKGAKDVKSNFLADHDLEGDDLVIMGLPDGEIITLAHVNRLRNDILKRTNRKKTQRAVEAEMISNLTEDLRDQFRRHLKTFKREVTEEVFLTLIGTGDDEQALQKKRYEARACVEGSENCPELPLNLRLTVPVDPLSVLQSPSFLSLYLPYPSQSYTDFTKYVAETAQTEAESLLPTLAEIVFNLNKNQDDLDTIIEARTAEQWQAAKARAEAGFHSRIRTNLIIMALRKISASPNKPFNIEAEAGQAVDTQENIDRLADYLFLDLTVDESHLTTQLAFTISRIQSFIQAVQLGTIPAYQPTSFDEDQWLWLKSYGSWHAWQMVSYYPENFLFPEMRRNTSPGFKEIIERLDEDIEQAATKYLNEINDYRGIRYDRSLVIEGNIFIFARSYSGKFIYSVITGEGNWIGWRSVPLNLDRFPVYQLSKIEIIYSNGYLNFFAVGGNIIQTPLPRYGFDELRLYHTSIEVVGDHLGSIAAGNEDQENNIAWNATDITLTTDDILLENESVLFAIAYEGEAKDSNRNTIGEGFKSVVYTLEESHVMSDIPGVGTYTYEGPGIYRVSFTINSGQIIKWGPLNGDYSTIEHSGENLIELCPVQNSDKLLWLIDPDPNVSGGIDLYWDHSYPRVDEEPFRTNVRRIIGGYFSTQSRTGYLFLQDSDAREYTIVEISDGNVKEIDRKQGYVWGMLSQLSTTMSLPLIEDPDPYYSDGITRTRYLTIEYDEKIAKTFYDAMVADDRGAYLYFEEAYLHLPIRVAQSLNDRQHYEEAVEWLRKIYDPLLPSEDRGRIYPPFKLQNIKTCSYVEMQSLLEDTLDPHAVASKCPELYLRNVKILQVRYLLDWADHLFVQDTNESVNRARELYELAADILETLELPEDAPTNTWKSFRAQQNHLLATLDVNDRLAIEGAVRELPENHLEEAILQVVDILSGSAPATFKVVAVEALQYKFPAEAVGLGTLMTQRDQNEPSTEAPPSNDAAGTTARSENDTAEKCLTGFGNWLYTLETELEAISVPRDTMAALLIDFDEKSIPNIDHLLSSLSSDEDDDVFEMFNSLQSLKEDWNELKTIPTNPPGWQEWSTTKDTWLESMRALLEGVRWWRDKEGLSPIRFVANLETLLTTLDTDLKAISVPHEDVEPLLSTWVEELASHIDACSGSFSSFKTLEEDWNELKPIPTDPLNWQEWSKTKDDWLKDAWDLLKEAGYQNESVLLDDFYIPPNPMIQLLQWQIESNLAKIRTNQNFAGIHRNLQPYATPLDPEKFMRSITSGGGVYDQALPSGPPSVYRYAFLLERAKYLTGVAQQFENSMLSSIEKEEEATYSYMRAKQDVQLERGNVTLQSLRQQEAEDAKRQALEQRARANTQRDYYDGLIEEGLSKWEKAAISLQWAAAAFYQASAVVSGIPFVGGNPLSSEAAALQATSSASQMHASFARREEEWKFQRDLAQHDINIADIGVDLADDRIDIVDQEWNIANRRLGFANDVIEYMENERFTNAQLYRWMNRNLEDLYQNQLNMAIATAKAAQQALEFERQTPLDFIGYDYWKDEKRGLLGAEQLLADLDKMEQFRLSSASRKREIEKTISLAAVAPVEFQNFRETGILDFATHMAWFDRDFPGHYMRLIHDVRLTLVALTPPNEGIHATLSNSGLSWVMVGEPFEEPTAIQRLPPESIAISSPYNATGLFELNPQDPMLFPFEGSGVATDWHLEMPKGANRFNYDTIYDVLFTIRYTALEDSSYREKVLDDMGQDENGYVTIEAVRSFSLRNGFPDQWYHFHNPVLGEGIEYADPITDSLALSSDESRPLKPYTMVIDLNQDDFLHNEEDCIVEKVTLAIQTSDEVAAEESGVEFKLKFVPEPGSVGSVFSDTITLTADKPHASTEATIYQPPFGQWILQLLDPEQIDPDWLEDMLFIVEYEADVHYPIR